MGLSIDSNPSHLAWIYDIYCRTGIRVPFPVIADRSGEISRKYGMISNDVSTTETVRNVFIIDDKGIVRLILVYPFYMFNNSVLISFLLVSSISLLSPYLENDNILIKNIKLTILYTIITIPFYGFINITYLLLGSLITLFVLFGLYPIIFINLLFPNLHNITSKVIIVLEELIKARLIDCLIQ